MNKFMTNSCNNSPDLDDDVLYRIIETQIGMPAYKEMSQKIATLSAENERLNKHVKDLSDIFAQWVSAAKSKKAEVKG